MAENYEGEATGYPSEVEMETQETPSPNFVVTLNSLAGTPRLVDGDGNDFPTDDETGVITIDTGGDSGNTVHYTVQTPTAPEKLIARTNIGVGVGNTPLFTGLQVTSAESVAEAVEGAWSSTVNAIDPNWRHMLLGINQVCASGGGFTQIDSDRTGWGLAFEADFLAPHGTLQHEAYFSTNGNERPFVLGMAPSVAAAVVGITTVAGPHSLVEITPPVSGITPYLIAGMRFFFTGTLNTPVGVAVGTAYKVHTVVTPTTFWLADAAGVEITGATSGTGTMNRGGWGSMGTYMPFSVNIGNIAGTEAYSNYKSADIIADTIASFENGVTGHTALVVIKNHAAGGTASLQFLSTSADWVAGTRDSLGTPDFLIYENAPLFGLTRFVLKSGGGAGFGTYPAAALHTVATTEQLRLGFDATNYATFTVGATGDLTIVPTGGDVAVTGTVTATQFVGGGSGLTGLDAGDIGAGTLAVARGGTGITSLGAGVANWLGTPSSANLATAVTDETGSGPLVFATLPTLTEPVFVDFTDPTKASTLKMSDQATGSSWNVYTPNANTRLLVSSYAHVLSGPTAAHTITLPDANFTVARTDAGQTFTGTNVFGITQATSLALGGAAIGSNALAVTGTSIFSSTATFSGSIIGPGATPVTISNASVATSGTNADFSINCGSAFSLLLKTGGSTRMGIGNGGLITVTNTTDSTTKDTGSIVTEGGIGVEKSIVAGGWIQWAGQSYIDANGTNATGTLATTGMSVTLAAGRKYSFKLILYVANSLAADGVKIDFDGGTATATNFRAHATLFDSALLLSQQVSALATDIAQATCTGDAMIEVHGSITVNAGGTFIPRYAGNSAVSGTLTLYRGSHLLMWDMP